MKLHHKEWPCVVLIKPGASGRNKGPALDEILPSELGTWRVWSSDLSVDRLYLYCSKNRYFQFSGTDDDLDAYFEDLIHPRIVRRGSRQTVEYPLYVIERKVGNRMILIISAPYAGLLTEIVTRMIRPRLGDGLMFVRPLIAKVYLMARSVATQPSPAKVEEALSPDRTSIVLRGGRITLSIDDSSISGTTQSASIKSLTLMGTNILKSELFSRLVDEGIYGLRFGLDPSLAKVAFKRGNALGVVVKMDQFGNFHYRPGHAGKNLDGVADLLIHCMEGDAIDKSYAVPVGRSQEGEL